MIPIAFEGANKVFGKPPSMTDEECAPLAVYDNGSEFLSIWTLDGAERAAIAKGGHVCLAVVGRGHPPVRLAVNYPPAIEVPA